MKFKIIKGHEPKPELIGLKRGEKNKYLRDHRPEILDYHYLHGQAAVRSRYYIVRDLTWDNFLYNGRRGRPPAKTTINPDWLLTRLQILEEDNRQLRMTIRTVSDDFHQFIPRVADHLAQQFVKGMLASMELPEDFDEGKRVDPLSLGKFAKRLEK